jgi:hypothetical protein
MSARYLLLCIILCKSTLITFSSPHYDEDNKFIYVSPLPGSTLVNEETNIIFKTSSSIQAIRDETNIIIVTGSLSGNHKCKITQVDNNTIIFKPYNAFSLGENVSVILKDRIITENNLSPKPYKFNFTIRSRKIKINILPYFGEDYPIPNERNSNPYQIIPQKNKSADSIPSDFPVITIIKNIGTAPGYVFLSNISFSPLYPTTPYLMILDNAGNPVFYRKMQSLCYDFKKENNLFTYYEARLAHFIAMDSTYNVIDSFKCGNGYSTDVHELRILPNQDAYMLSYDPEPVDMSKIVQDGDTNAIVTGLIIQEIDQNKDVVFQWRSWDHFKITDATHENLTAHNIDYVHGNAIEFDDDGNILLSCRHMDEITKINRQTGEIIWRMGGKNNQFNFPNDPIGFSHQHAIRMLNNGHLTMFDNGNYHNPPFSRAVEYIVDEHTKVVSLVWQFRHSPDAYGGAMGYVQRLPNGNTLIGWGASTDATVTEVKPDGTVVFELDFPFFIYSYRAFRIELGNTGNPRVVNQPYEFRLSQNYPNPFNIETIIHYTLGSNNNVKLTLFDLLGRKIKTIVDENQQAGDHLYVFNGINESSGVYFYKLQTEKSSDIKKMVLLK